MKGGFLLDTGKKKKKAPSDQLGPLEDERVMPRTYGGFTARPSASSWGTRSVRDTAPSATNTWGSPSVGGASLGKASLDWKLPATVTTTTTTSNLTSGWGSLVPRADSSDNVTVSTFASTLPSTTSSSANRHQQQHAQQQQQQHAPANPYTGIPLSKTNKSAGAPKSALHYVYGQPPRRKVLATTDYHTWHDGGPPHALKFSSIFVCPLTGECFASGRYGSPAFYHSDESAGLVWFKKKVLAEHGAAARAFDCWSVRDSEPGMMPETVGEDEAYDVDHQPEMSLAVPPNTLQAIRVAQEQIRHQQNAPMEVEHDEDEEAAWRTRPEDDRARAKDLFG